LQEVIYTVNFPGLGLSFKVSPIAFCIGNFPIHWYGLIISLGFLLAFLYTASRATSFRVNIGHFTDAVLVGTIFGVICARIYYVIFFPGDDYIKNPISIFCVWDGGIAIYGALMGGIAAGLISTKNHKMNVWSTLDLASFGFLIGQAVCRWGNFVNQEAFGSKTDLPWRMVSETTDGMGVHPCFLYESLWCILGFIILHIFSERLCKKQGQIFSLYLIWYGTGRVFIESLRTDSLLIPKTSIRVSQLVSITFILIGLIFLFLSYRKKTVSKIAKTT
jgi:phosphatidylglycerol:prolipoprotein diacylglycerol transferase